MFGGDGVIVGWSGGNGINVHPLASLPCSGFDVFDVFSEVK